MRRVKRIFILFFVVVSISSCIQQPPPQLFFPFDLMMRANDLPDGWVEDKNRFKDIPDSMTYVIYFGRDEPENNLSAISHWLAIYENHQAAEKACPEWVEKWIVNDSWIAADDSQFTPASTNDEYVLKCTDLYANGWHRSCTYLQLHENVIVMVLVNIGETISMDEFDQVLYRLDQRLSAKDSIPFPAAENGSP